MKAAWGAVFAAGAASVCCIGPVVAVLAGASTLTAVAMQFEPYRPALVGVTAILFGAAFYAVYRRDCDTACSPRSRV